MIIFDMINNDQRNQPADLEVQKDNKRLKLIITCILEFVLYFHDFYESD